MQQFLDEILVSDFFSRNCGMAAEQKESLDWKVCIVKSMMLLDGECFDAKQRNILKSAVEYLENAFLRKGIVSGIEEIPLLIYLADKAQDWGIAPECFAKWWIDMR